MIANLQLICVQEHGGRPVLRQFRPNFGHLIQRYIRSKLESFGYLIMYIIHKIVQFAVAVLMYSSIYRLHHAELYCSSNGENMDSVAVG